MGNGHNVSMDDFGYSGDPKSSLFLELSHGLGELCTKNEAAEWLFFLAY